MLWRGRRQSSNIEDARGQGGGGLPGGFGDNRVRIPMGRGGRTGGGIGTIIILVVIYFGLKFMGIDPMQILGGGSGTGTQGGGGTVSETSPPANDEMKQFVATVLAETEDTWNGIFQAQGSQYEEPTLTLFSGQVDSACGLASSASGPFYCPRDRKVYLDTVFFDQLTSQFGASGDFAEAYVVAHEVGHHVQNLTGILSKFNEQRQQMSEADANAMSVRVELQADCFAGIGDISPTRKGSSNRAISRRRSMRPNRSATIRCRRRRAGEAGSPTVRLPRRPCPWARPSRCQAAAATCGPRRCALPVAGDVDGVDVEAADQVDGVDDVRAAGGHLPVAVDRHPHRVPDLGGAPDGVGVSLDVARVPHVEDLRAAAVEAGGHEPARAVVEPVRGAERADGSGKVPRSESSTLSSGTIADFVPSSRLTHQVWNDPALVQSGCS